MKTKTLITTLCLAFFLTTASVNAQWWGSEKVKGNGNMVTKERKTGDYDVISVAGSFDVELVSGSEGNITINAEENLIKHIETEVKGDALKIKTEKGYNLHASRGKKILITVPFKNISKVSLAGSGDVFTKNSSIKASSFKASLKGSGDIVLDVDAATVKGNLEGSGDLILRGSATDFECNVEGSGDIDAYNLIAKDVEASIAGSGDIRIHCDGGALKAHIAGSGDIKYKGNPDKEDTKVSGSGSISKG